MSDANTFETKGCVRVNNFIDEQTVSVVSDYFQNKLRRGEWREGHEGPQAASRYFYYADPLVEILLLKSQQAVEEATGKELIPTYSYARIYQPGEELTPHVDRPACEISVTVNIASKGEASPIYMRYENNETEEHVLAPGDAVVYKGCEATHWRRPLQDDQLTVQLMLHYVDKNGPNAQYAKDQRSAYGMPSTARRK